MLTGLLYNIWSFLLLFSIIHIGCWIEYLKMVEKIYTITIDPVNKWVFAICGFIMMVVFGLQINSTESGAALWEASFSSDLLFLVVVIACPFIFISRNKQMTAHIRWACMAGFLYLSLPFTCLLNLRDSFVPAAEFDLIDHGKIYACVIIFSIWINDTMAYIVGSMIGKTPFSKISPKKTWEGTIGGALLCIVVIGLSATLIPVTKSIAWYHWVSIAAICAVFGTLGDLLESKLKRIAGIKDSGTIMPGHGGFLDRFDSLLIATPFVWLYIKLFL